LTEKEKLEEMHNSEHVYSENEKLDSDHVLAEILRKVENKKISESKSKEESN
jgi:hypothetical protein